MPLDGKLADYQIDMSVLQQGHEGLKQMSYLLRHPEIWDKGFVWDYSQILERPNDNHCGSIGCAIGVASLYWGESTNRVSVKLTGAGVLTIGEGIRATREIFFSDTEYREPMREITPEIVANKIDEYLETHDAT